jgi:hypothetical protein
VGGVDALLILLDIGNVEPETLLQLGPCSYL